MRVAFFGLVAALALPGSSITQAQVPNPGSEGRIALKWLQDYEQVLRQAKSEKKPVLVDFTTDWCSWSKKMDRETFAKKDVQKELRDFLLIRINPEANDTNKTIGEDFNISSYPTLVVVNHLGEETGRREGYLVEKEMLTFLKDQLMLFKGNPLGYKPVKLELSDPLLSALKRLPKPEEMPAEEAAIIVVDHTTGLIRPNGKARFEVRTSYYIVDNEQSGMPQASVSFNPSRQKSTFKSIRILNTAGEGREVDLRLAKEENLYSNESVYWDIRNLTVPLPALKNGEILDVIEERECQPVVPGEFYFRWNTGVKVLLDSEFSLTFPKEVKMQKVAVICDQPVVETQNKDGTVTWLLKTSHREHDDYELFCSPADLFEGYEFFAGCDPDNLATWYSGLCTGRDALPASAKERVAEIIKDHVSQRDRVQALLDWVTKDIRYVSVTFKMATHQPHSVKETLSNGYGDCKDQALLLQALCKEAGISSRQVLIGMAYGEEPPLDRPAVEMFSHCILQATVDGAPCYLDATAGAGPAGRVPKSYAGQSGLCIDGTKGVPVRLQEYTPETPEIRTKEIKLNPNGSATITETYTLIGERAKEVKEEWKPNDPERARKNLEAEYKRSGRKLLDFFVTDANDPGTNFVRRISYTTPRAATRTAAGLMLRLGRGDAGWLQRLDTPRKRPFYFPASDWSQNETTVILPGKIKEIPGDLNLKLEFLEATRHLTLKDNTMQMTEKFRLINSRLDPKEAPKVVEAFRKLDEHQGYAYFIEVPALEK